MFGRKRKAGKVPGTQTAEVDGAIGRIAREMEMPLHFAVDGDPEVGPSARQVAYQRGRDNGLEANILGDGHESYTPEFLLDLAMRARGRARAAEEAGAYRQQGFHSVIAERYEVRAEQAAVDQAPPVAENREGDTWKDLGSRRDTRAMIRDIVAEDESLIMRLGTAVPVLAKTEADYIRESCARAGRETLAELTREDHLTFAEDCARKALIAPTHEEDAYLRALSQRHTDQARHAPSDQDLQSEFTSGPLKGVTVRYSHSGGYRPRLWEASRILHLWNEGGQFVAPDIAEILEPLLEHKGDEVGPIGGALAKASEQLAKYLGWDTSGGIACLLIGGTLDERKEVAEALVKIHEGKDYIRELHRRQAGEVDLAVRTAEESVRAEMQEKIDGLTAQVEDLVAKNHRQARMLTNGFTPVDGGLTATPAVAPEVECLERKLTQVEVNLHLSERSHAATRLKLMVAERDKKKAEQQRTRVADKAYKRGLARGRKQAEPRLATGGRISADKLRLTIGPDVDRALANLRKEYEAKRLMTPGGGFLEWIRRMNTTSGVGAVDIPEPAPLTDTPVVLSFDGTAQCCEPFEVVNRGTWSEAILDAYRDTAIDGDEAQKPETD